MKRLESSKNSDAAGKTAKADAEATERMTHATNLLERDLAGAPPEEFTHLVDLFACPPDLMSHLYNQKN